MSKRYGIFKWEARGEYPRHRAIGKLYVVKNAAQRAADKMILSEPGSNLVVRAVWID